ncbi:hypothetical protein EAH68_14000 [Corynebacterium hylobatis]|uniref:SAF domain-containing protein n=1 Tax=Corynebacterium hylobatis TaxID=1859290 RepID=A0A3S0AUL8_9CORY|nr:SAF domain-containing protein [Corynebacterium hylobatis]RSZ61258.1 hypothetical protein EAH68_14000 [Corynebacterium hylobatis]
MNQLRNTLTTPGWRRTVLLRRCLAFLLLLAALLLALRQAGATDERALVFTRPVAAGETLSPDNVSPVPVPDHLLPATALVDPAEVDGQVLAVPAEQGEVVTARRLVGPELAAAFPGDIGTFIPVRPAEPEVIGLLHHGDTVSVITHGGDGTGTEVIATGGRVVLADSREAPGTLLIGFPEEDARAVAAASLATPLAVVLTPTTHENESGTLKSEG